MKFKRLILIVLSVVTFLSAYKISVHPKVLKVLFPNKIWAHRVNSEIKLQESIINFKGVELDIIWKKNKFDVNHPPSKSIGLSLAKYFSTDSKLKNIGIWLDYKNLNGDNSERSAFYLDSLLGVYNLSKNNVYVETNKPLFLDPFLKRGFRTSYYLPSGLHNIKADSVPKAVELINKRLSRNKNIYISAPLSDYSFMKQYFPERNKLLWHLGGLNSFSNKIKIHNALLDEKVKVLLRPFKSKTGDR